MSATLRHTVLLTFVEGTDPARIDAIVAAIEDLPHQVGMLRAIEVARDLGLDARSAHLLISAEFDSVEDWQAYQAHPAHQEVVGTLVAPVLASRAAVQQAIGAAVTPA
jgi:hypothetical protein